jgi:hypothetical protein
MVVGVEAIFGYSNAVIESVGLFHLDKVYNLLQFSHHTCGGRVILQFEKESLRVVQESNEVSRSVYKMFIEFISSPLDAMLDLIREVSEGAHWNGFFWWILRITVALSLVRNDHLRVSFGSEGS